MAAEPPSFWLLLIGDRGLVDAWTADFAGWDESVVIEYGRFQEHLGSYEALLAPGNSYGQMNGGIDGAISAEFAPVQRNVWRAIADHHHGYQPVGTAQVVETGDARCPFLVYAPTMRIPMRLRGGLEIAVYDALWAARSPLNDTTPRLRVRAESPHSRVLAWAQASAASRPSDCTADGCRIPALARQCGLADQPARERPRLTSRQERSSSQRSPQCRPWWHFPQFRRSQTSVKRSGRGGLWASTTARCVAPSRASRSPTP